MGHGRSSAGSQPAGGSEGPIRQLAWAGRYHPCPAGPGPHWGPNGAAGVLPFAVTPDGRAWVLLSHRSAYVQSGDTWSTFGGAIDGSETPWCAAVRETREEIDGIDVRSGDVVAELKAPCQHACGWSYTTFVVRIPLTEAGGLPDARVASGHAAWETAGLAWVPADEVAMNPDLHPSFRSAWPALRDAISGTEQ